MYDVAIVGGGPAGLQAALTLGRMHRPTVLIDSGRYRNARVERMQNLVTHDGQDPAALRDAGRREIARYGAVEMRTAEVGRIDGTTGAFALSLDDGGEVRARRVILATGVADRLPDIPGLDDLFGTVAAHCPFCHGHEFADRTVALIGPSDHAPRLAAMLRPIAAETILLAHGAELDPTVQAQLGRLGTRMIAAPVASVQAREDGAEVVFADGTSLAVGGVLVASAWRQAAPFAQQLGLELTPAGAIAVDALGRTSVPGVLAAGDAAVGPGLPAPMHAVALAIAAGLTAAAACVQEFVAEELAGL